MLGTTHNTRYTHCVTHHPTYFIVRPPPLSPLSSLPLEKNAKVFLAALLVLAWRGELTKSDGRNDTGDGRGDQVQCQWCSSALMLIFSCSKRNLFYLKNISPDSAMSSIRWVTLLCSYRVNQFIFYADQDHLSDQHVTLPVKPWPRAKLIVKIYGLILFSHSCGPATKWNDKLP